MKFLAFAIVAVISGALYAKHTTSSTTTESTLVKSTPSTVVTDQLKDGQKTRRILRGKINQSRVIYLNTEVNYESSQRVANKIKELNASSSEDIFLLLDSPGGSVLDGATVISEIEASKAHVNTVCTRLCASMAAMIHSYGYRRFATDRAILMYHPASAGAQGQVPNILSQLTTISHYLDKMVDNVVARSKVSHAEFDKLVSYELWIDAEDAETKGFVDGVVSLDVPSGEKSALSLDSGATPEKPDGDKVKTVTPVKPNIYPLKMIAPDLGYWNRNASKN